ncbi:MAG: hypothetical protein Q4G21_11305 [Dermabacter sp.]|nr:hypothetical protein [Dermabacter sp.]
MSIPDWLAEYSALDDDALAVVGNRGLVRRAHALVGEDHAALISASPSSVVVDVDQQSVRLEPGGPRVARCACPVPGPCVHIVAACLWARRVVSVGAQDSGPPPDVIAEVLSWMPETLNRAAGLAAVRRVARDHESGPLTIEVRGTQLFVSWPSSPRVMLLAGAGPAGMVVEGSHSDASERYWKLAAVVRLFAHHGRAWAWPESATPEAAGPDTRGSGAIPPPVSATAAEVATLIEHLTTGGISRVAPAAVDRLSRAAERATLDGSPLLARLAREASAEARTLTGRDDGADEARVLSALAQAWALARLLASGRAPASLASAAPASRPGASPESDPLHLVPLATVWWSAPMGARGLTLHLWNPASGRLERATTGRAAGMDPGFRRTSVGPLLWGTSVTQLTAGPLEVVGARRRADGTLAASRPTTCTSGSWEGVDLAGLSRDVNAVDQGAAGLAFGALDPRLRMIRPRVSGKRGGVALDEAAQRLVWALTDASGREYRLTLEATDRDHEWLTWLVSHPGLEAVVAVGDRPESAFLFENGQVSLVSRTFADPAPERKPRRGRTRLENPGTLTRASAPRAEEDGLQRLCGAVGDLAVSLAARGPSQLTEHQRGAAARHHREASDLGLTTLAAALAPLTRAEATAAAVLRLRFVLDRLEALVD